MSDGRHTRARSNGWRATRGQPTTQDVDWLMAHLRRLVAASPPAVWAGRGMTLTQLVTMHVISALAPVSLTGLAKALGTRPPATSAMVDRLTDVGMVCRTPDPQNRRQIKVTLTSAAELIIGNTDLETAKRLHAVLASMTARARSHLLDVLRDSVQRSAV